MVREVSQHLGSTGLDRAKSLKIYLWGGRAKVAWSYLRVSSFETVPQGQFTPAQRQPPAASWELKVWLLILPWNGVTGLSVEQSEEMPAESGPCKAHLHPRAASAAHMTGFLTEQSFTVLRKRTILVVARPKRVASDSSLRDRARQPQF